VPSDLSPNALATHDDRLRRAARHLCASPHDAEDLLQDTYVSVLRKRRRLDSADAELGYLMRALRNTHMSNLRRGKRGPEVATIACAEASAVPARTASPLTLVFVGEVLRAIAALPTEQRATLTAVDVVGLSYNEAARALDTPVGTIMSRLHRGRGRLAQAIAT
jgi:RNA polymerase sigma-70 factor, ECF subfamily